MGVAVGIKHDHAWQKGRDLIPGVSGTTDIEAVPVNADKILTVTVQ